MQLARWIRGLPAVVSDPQCTGSVPTERGGCASKLHVVSPVATVARCRISVLGPSLVLLTVEDLKQS